MEQNDKFQHLTNIEIYFMLLERSILPPSYDKIDRKVLISILVNDIFNKENELYNKLNNELNSLTLNVLKKLTREMGLKLKVNGKGNKQDLINRIIQNSEKYKNYHPIININQNNSIKNDCIKNIIEAKKIINYELKFSFPILIYYRKYLCNKNNNNNNNKLEKTSDLRVIKYKDQHNKFWVQKCGGYLEINEILNYDILYQSQFLKHHLPLFGNIPYFKHEKYGNILTMEYFPFTLDVIINKYKNSRNKSKTIQWSNIGYNLLKLLYEINKLGYHHCDIKPENIALKGSDITDINNYVLIDLVTLTSINNPKKISGTLIYSTYLYTEKYFILSKSEHIISNNINFFYNHRQDIESILYIIIEMMLICNGEKELPWLPKLYHYKYSEYSSKKINFLNNIDNYNLPIDQINFIKNYNNIININYSNNISKLDYILYIDNLLLNLF